MSAPLQPVVAVGLDIIRDAEGSPDTTTQTVVASTRPRALEARFVEGRVVSFDPIRRELSDDQGAPRMSTAGVTLNDDDGLIRGAMAENPQRFVTQTEARVQILSEQGLAAGSTWRYLHRGRVEDATVGIERNNLQRKRTVKLSFVDVLAPYYDRYINDVLYLRQNFPDIDRRLENTPIPIIGGEHSDAGAQDSNGGNAEKGLIPLDYVGTYQTVDDNPLSGEAAYLAPPTGLGFIVNGTAGTTWRYYALTKRSDVGETTLSDVLLVATGNATLTAVNSITISWTDDADATGWVLYRGTYPTPSRRIAVIPAGTTSFIDTGAYPEVPPGPPARNTAQIPGVDDGFRWDLYVVGRGELEITGLFGSNVSEGVPPARINLLETAGVDFLIPGYAGWPHGTNTVVIGGDELTVIYGRGPRSQHHIDGVVTLAVSVCGMTGDNGESIQQAFPLLQQILTQFVPTDGGEVWRRGDWLPLRLFPDATPHFTPEDFTACQDLTKQFLASPEEGYRGAIYIREPTTVRDLIQSFLQTFDCFWVTNHHGQGRPVLVNPYADPADGRLYRERIEIVRLENPTLDRSNVVPRVSFQYDFDPDANAMRSEAEVIEDEQALAEQPGNYRDRGTMQLVWTRDAATARDAMSRRVQRLKYPRWMQPLVTKFRGLEDEPGDQVLITHADAPDQNGWTTQPCYISAHEADTMRDEVTLTCIDIRAFLAQWAPPLGDEDDEEFDGFILGDEDSLEAPPIGAYRLT